MRKLLPYALLFVAAACASTSPDRPSDIAQPEIRLRPTGPVFLSQGTSPLTIEVQVRNLATVPITIREVDVSSPDRGQYSVGPARKLFEETVPPGETRTVALTAAITPQNTGSPVGEPVHVRGFVRFEANGRAFREVVIEQFSPLP